VTAPPVSLHELTARQAGQLFRLGALSPVELTTALLERAAQTEPRIHAYVEVLADDALAAARQAESELRSGHDRGPLHGIPLGVKDIFDMRGHPTRCGSRVREQAAPATEDARAVALLRAAGANPIGKTVTQEFAAGVVSVPCRNPWDPMRIPGGSSGGSGAAVAVGSCTIALGSDTGGSIRIPASVNGVVGLKPTYGRVSKRGAFPLSWSLDTVGPLARTVDDAALMLNAIAGHDPGDVTTSTRPVADATGELRQGVRGLRLGVPRSYFWDRLQPGVRTAVETALGVFSALGAEVIDTPWPDVQAMRAIGFVINRIESSAIHEMTVREQPNLYENDLRLRLQTGLLVAGTGYLRARRARVALRQAIARFFAEHRLDALVTPTLPAVAVPADRLLVTFDDGDEALLSAYTRLTMPFNATGQPALSLPCGFDAAGLPVGLQIVGTPFAEASLCRIGHAYEEATDWHNRRPPL
jgi:aspartyl-tRNA(Asn)/glutamyl-tRNA(Gln) amidotransferase subunit A